MGWVGEGLTQPALFSPARPSQKSAMPYPVSMVRTRRGKATRVHTHGARVRICWGEWGPVPPLHQGEVMDGEGGLI